MSPETKHSNYKTNDKWKVFKTVWHAVVHK